jgi:cation transport protein ChaC
MNVPPTLASPAGAAADIPYAHLLPAQGDLWVFGYGSLMWNPGFEFITAERAVLHGYHRAFCMYSERHRGTPERPGLVLALDRGGSCRGIAYRVRRAIATDVLAYLWHREMPRYAYLPRRLRVTFRNESAVCVTFIADRAKPNYAGRLTPEQAAPIIARAVGERGSNRDYLASTVRHLDELGIPAGRIHEILRLVQRF